MIGYHGNIEELTEENTDFRRVLYSGSKLQLVLMSLAPGTETGGEIHSDTDQFFRVEDGEGRLVVDGTTHKPALFIEIGRNWLRAPESAVDSSC